MPVQPDFTVNPDWLLFTCPPPCPRRMMTADQIAATNTLIASLEDAYNQLMLSTTVRVFVDQNGERLEFATANADKLKAYIERLYAKLPNYCPDVVRPMRFFF